MAESQSYEESQYNLASQGHRQPGVDVQGRSCSPTRSRAGSIRTATYYDSHTLSSPGWLTGYPTYEVKTFGGEQNGTINLVQATLKSDNTVYAQLAADLGEPTVTEMAHKMGVVSPLHSYAAEALGGLTLGVTPLGRMANVYATLADGRLAQQPDRESPKWLFPGRSRGQQLGQAASREGAERRRHRRGDADPQRERRKAAPPGRSAISWPVGGEDRHDLRNSSTRGSMATRRTTRPPYGWAIRPKTRVHGPTSTASRRQGRLPACGNLARIHVRGGRRKVVARNSPSAKESLSYEPFYGKIRHHGASRARRANPNAKNRRAKRNPPTPTPPAGYRGGAGGPRPADNPYARTGDAAPRSADARNGRSLTGLRRRRQPPLAPDAGKFGPQLKFRQPPARKARGARWGMRRSGKGGQG